MDRKLLVIVLGIICLFESALAFENLVAKVRRKFREFAAADKTMDITQFKKLAEDINFHGDPESAFAAISNNTPFKEQVLVDYVGSRNKDLNFAFINIPEEFEEKVRKLYRHFAPEKGVKMFCVAYSAMLKYLGYGEDDYQEMFNAVNSEKWFNEDEYWSYVSQENGNLTTRLQKAELPPKQG